MAHELEIVNGQAQMAYVGEVPWHGLGTAVPADLTSEQMMQAAGLDWTVEKMPSYYDGPDGKLLTGQHALVRSTDRKILTNISDNWEPVQNADAFQFFHDFVMDGDMEMHTAGSMFGGKRVWALAKVKESFEVMDGDKVENFLLFSNPHEYGRAIDVRFTSIRCVCNNTVTLAINEQVDRWIRLNHRRKFDAEAVKKMLGIAKVKFNQFEEVSQFLASRKAASDDVIRYLAEVFPSASKNRPSDADYLSRPAEKVLANLETQPGAEFGEGTWWQAFNAVTYTADHILGQSVETRIQSSWYGQNRLRKITALEKAVEYAEAS